MSVTVITVIEVTLENTKRRNVTQSLDSIKSNSDLTLSIFRTNTSPSCSKTYAAVGMNDSIFWVITRRQVL